MRQKLLNSKFTFEAKDHPLHPSTQQSPTEGPIEVPEVHCKVEKEESPERGSSLPRHEHQCRAPT